MVLVDGVEYCADKIDAVLDDLKNISQVNLNVVMNEVVELENFV